MGRTIGKLSALAVARTTKPGYHHDGGGLYLQVTASGAKSWVFRFKSPVTGKMCEMGLGAFASVPLIRSRALAASSREAVAAGRDPKLERDAARAAARAQTASARTFAQCSAAYIDAHRAGWRNDKHAGQWASTLATYADPVFGTLPVQEINTAMVLRVLEPIWRTKPETASRLRGRIESVLAWATTHGYRRGDNPASWRGHLDNLLPARTAVRAVEHHAALPYAQMREFIADLRTRDGMAARALGFAILTAARSGEVRGATWDEIDLPGKTWTVPASRMKARREHRVPLSDEAVALLSALPRMTDTNLVFPAPRGGPLSDMTLTAVLRRMGRADVTCHGFRSTFRDWAGETTAFPREVIEHALAHQLKDKAEAAYQRGDLLAKRALLMQAWADYCARTATEGTVIPLRVSEA